MKRLQKLILAIGLMLLISGTAIIVATIGDLIPNKQYYSTQMDLEPHPLTPKEYTFFHDLLDEEDKAHVHLEMSRTEFSAVNLEMAMEYKARYNLSIYIRNSQDTILRHEEYNSESLEKEGAMFDPEQVYHLVGWAYPVDIFFQVPEYDKYKMSVVVQAWHLEREYHSDPSQKPPWRLRNISEPVDITLWVDIETQKATPNSTFIFLGLVILLAGVVPITLSFLKKFK